MLKRKDFFFFLTLVFYNICSVKECQDDFLKKKKKKTVFNDFWCGGHFQIPGLFKGSPWWRINPVLCIVLVRTASVWLKNEYVQFSYMYQIVFKKLLYRK